MVARSSVTTRSTRWFSISREQRTKNKEHVSIAALFSVLCSFTKVLREVHAVSHPALLLVDAVSSLAVMDYRHDDWGVDVSISGSQKGLMVPPGLSFNAVSEKALAASTQPGLPRSYWSWQPMLDQNASGFFPFTPPISLLYGLAESITMLHEFGLENVFARHERHAESVRRAVKTWGLELWCRDARS